MDPPLGRASLATEESSSDHKERRHCELRHLDEPTTSSQASRLGNKFTHPAVVDDSRWHRDRLAANQSSAVLIFILNLSSAPVRYLVCLLCRTGILQVN